MLLAAAAIDPKQLLTDLPVISPEERREILTEWNPTKISEVGEETIAELFEERVRQRWEAVAVVSGE